MSSHAAVATRFKTALKLAIQRLRNSAAKKEALNKKERRSVASLLEKGKLETARVRVETIVNEEIFVELLEVLELFCELCLARYGLIEQSREVDPNIAEAVNGIIFAAPKTDIKELQNVSSLFLQHYGREYAVKCIENQDGMVSSRVTKKLTIHTPSPQLVDAYLLEIAKAYSVDWRPDDMLPDGQEAAQQSESSTSKNLKGLSLEERETAASLPQPPPTVPADADRVVSIHATLPTQPLVSQAQAADIFATQSTISPTSTTKSKEDQDFDALKRRFEALKKR